MPNINSCISNADIAQTVDFTGVAHVKYVGGMDDRAAKCIIIYQFSMINLRETVKNKIKRTQNFLSGAIPKCYFKIFNKIEKERKTIGSSESIINNLFSCH